MFEFSVKFEKLSTKTYHKFPSLAHKLKEVSQLKSSVKPPDISPHPSGKINPPTKNPWKNTNSRPNFPQ